jgi:hypothetical protein
MRLCVGAIAAAIPLLVFFVVSSRRGTSNEPRIVEPPRGTSEVRETPAVVDAAVAPVVDAAAVAIDAEVVAAPVDAAVEPATPVDAAVQKPKPKPKPVIKRKDYGESRD